MVELTPRTSNTVFLHCCHLLQREAQSVYHEDHLCCIEPIQFIELDGSDEEDEKDEETIAKNERVSEASGSFELTSCIPRQSVLQVLSNYKGIGASGTVQTCERAHR